MKTEYIAQYKHKKDECNDKWSNAVWYVTGRRTASTREEAEDCLNKVLKQFNRGERVEYNMAGSIGISTHIDSSTADSLSIVATRIMCREVTDWEEC